MSMELNTTNSTAEVSVLDVHKYLCWNCVAKSFAHNYVVASASRTFQQTPLLCPMDQHERLNLQESCSLALLQVPASRHNLFAI
eukprot:5221-Amphidinium_carterae.1